MTELEIQITNLVNRVKNALIETNNSKESHEMYLWFKSDCDRFDLNEEGFYVKILKQAYLLVNWEEEEKRQQEENEKKNREEEQKRQQEEREKEEKKRQQEQCEKKKREEEQRRQQEEKEKEELKRQQEQREKKKREEEQRRQQEEKEKLKRQQEQREKWEQDQERKKLKHKALWATIFLLVAAFLALYLIWYKPYLEDKNATKMYSYANSLTLRSSPAAGSDFNAISNLKFGTEVLVYSQNGDWANCKANGKKGYVATQFLLDKKSYNELNGILADESTRGAIPTTKCRRALLDYFNEKGIMGKIAPEIQRELYGAIQNKEVWQVFAKPKNSNPNNVAYPKVVKSNGKFTDFACIIKNITTGKRKCILFSFSDDEKAILQSEQDAPSEGYIQSVSKYPFNVTYVY